jgi:propanol-preferring alcohol dehydrogenase
MEACGICHSDLFVAGLEKLPLVPLTLGHEGVGRVVEAAPDTGFQTGDRAGITFLASTCGTCDLCRAGLERYCAKQKNSGYTVHGAMASFATAPAQHLVRIPASIDPAEAAPLCCAGWTAMGGIRAAALSPGQSVALFGFGGLGHLALQYAKSSGLRTAVADVSEAKLEHARALGADVAVDASTAGRTIQKEHGGVDAAVVFTGNPAAIEQAFRSVKRTGTVVLVGLSSNTYTLPLIDTVLKGVAVRGSYLGTKQDLEDVFQLAESGAVRPKVTTYEVAEAPSVLDRLHRGEVEGRAVVRFR